MRNSADIPFTQGPALADALAPVPEGWLNVDTGRALRFGSIALALACLVLLASAWANAGNPEIENPERTVISAGVLGVFAFLSWAFGAVRRPPRRAPRLANAVDFTDASVAPSDSWVHFSAFRAPQWPAIVGLFVVGLGAAALAVTFTIFPAKFAPEPQWLAQIIVWIGALVCAVFAVFFVYGAVTTLRTQRANGGWPRRYGVTLGESGIALRLATVDREVPWSDIIEISPAILNDGDRRNRIPVIKIVWATIDSSARRKVTPTNIALSSFDVAPHMLYTALSFYWRNSEARDELGTTVAQRRLEAWTKASN